jgi:hypothetical protein
MIHLYEWVKFMYVYILKTIADQDRQFLADIKVIRIISPCTALHLVSDTNAFTRLGIIWDFVATNMELIWCIWKDRAYLNMPF